MNTFTKIVTLTPFCVLLLCTDGFATEIKSKTVKTDVNKESYSIGASTGNYVVNQVVRQKELGLKTNIDEIIKGFTDAFKGKLQLNDEEIITYLNARAENLNILKLEREKQIKKENLEKGKKYLVENKAKKGVKETKSGLQYEVLKKGKGKKVQPESIVVVNYKAQLVDGTVFDETYKRKAPAHLSMINLIEGMQEGLLMMEEGSKYKLTIPSTLAYKEKGVADVPPNAVIIFEIELLKVLAPGEFKEMAHKDANVTVQTKKDVAKK